MKVSAGHRVFGVTVGPQPCADVRASVGLFAHGRLHPLTVATPVRDVRLDFEPGPSKENRVSARRPGPVLGKVRRVGQAVARDAQMVLDEFWVRAIRDGEDVGHEEHGGSDESNDDESDKMTFHGDFVK